MARGLAAIRPLALTGCRRGEVLDLTPAQHRRGRLQPRRCQDRARVLRRLIEACAIANLEQAHTMSEIDDRGRDPVEVVNTDKEAGTPRRRTN